MFLYYNQKLFKIRLININSLDYNKKNIRYNILKKISNILINIHLINRFSFILSY